ncbi:DUF3159 domain-containing protein [Demequina lignilytica]|uniref:DUF3159 domain-containing protein n=1 Tax=Demequina lignilytica TaxID=3051663 RepID=A0AAW7M7D0_9MICO|nr:MULTISPECIES: DUF3159 domain-containing protein [unclassified Demequina]MDN4482122.1 DUF3159 domain-containing protein [Demequina sp. SYSU T0a273]MDN4486780.1 DUF3159 domain-containing protein [Demequina sp. SYSU T00039]MDN4489464.1 DUF3159 domain-containing protein [Demequina sp. SYSU T00068]
MKADDSAAGRLLGGDSFSMHEAIGGWRGFIESSAPGIAFVAAYVIVGGFRVPVIAAVAVMAVLVVARVIQRTPPTQALSGAIGVAIGAIWAWRSGDASGYFVPGLWLNAAYLAGILLSMAVGWPVVGIVMGLLRGEGTRWRANPAERRRFQLASAVLAAMFALRLAVQVPLLLADQTAVLGTVKLAMGVPLFALTLWGVWLLARDAGPAPATQDPPPTTR